MAQKEAQLFFKSGFELMAVDSMLQPLSLVLSATGSGLLQEIPACCWAFGLESLSRLYHRVHCAL